jgi:Sensors of blue-light using FAD
MSRNREAVRGLSATAEGANVSSKEVRLIYVSRQVQPFKLSEYIALSDMSADRNKQLGITGLLISSLSCFMQVLEGDERSVNDTYLKVARDRRHFDVTLVRYELAHSRMVQDWNMRYYDADQTTLDAPWSAHVEDSAFRPFPTHPDAGLRLLLLCQKRMLGAELRAAS